MPRREMYKLKMSITGMSEIGFSRAEELGWVRAYWILELPARLYERASEHTDVRRFIRSGFIFHYPHGRSIGIRLSPMALMSSAMWTGSGRVL
jgi:hypothetical protein